MTKSLRLIAQDEEDLTILSAYLQGALLCASEMIYLPKQRRFALVLDRLLWEENEDAGEKGARIRTGLHFDGVLNVQTQNIDRSGKKLLHLLALGFERGAEGAGAIEFILAEDGRIRLNVECIDATIRDLETSGDAA
jgi:hypothetical protein